MTNKRNWVLWAVLGLILITANTLILSKEVILSQGETILLELAPLDPRSLLQGDYMVLRYAVAEAVRPELSATESTNGHVVVAVDQNNVADFVRLYSEGTPLAANERLLYFRKRGRSVNLASNAFFFQEDHQSLYLNAQFGELKINRDGDAVLVGLRGPDLERLGPGDMESAPQ